MIPSLSDFSQPQRPNLPTLSYRRVREHGTRNRNMIQAFKLMNDVDGFDKLQSSSLQMSNTGLHGDSKSFAKTQEISFINRITLQWNITCRNSKDLISFENNLDNRWKSQDLECHNFKAEIKIGPERSDWPGTPPTNINLECNITSPNFSQACDLIDL